MVCVRARACTCMLALLYMSRIKSPRPLTLFLSEDVDTLANQNTIRQFSGNVYQKCVHMRVHACRLLCPKQCKAMHIHNNLHFKSILSKWTDFCGLWDGQGRAV